MDGHTARDILKPNLAGRIWRGINKTRQAQAAGRMSTKGLKPRTALSTAGGKGRLNMLPHLRLAFICGHARQAHKHHCQEVYQSSPLHCGGYEITREEGGDHHQHGCRSNRNHAAPPTAPREAIVTSARAQEHPGTIAVALLCSVVDCGAALATLRPKANCSFM